MLRSFQLKFVYLKLILLLNYFILSNLCSGSDLPLDESITPSLKVTCVSPLTDSLTLPAFIVIDYDDTLVDSKIAYLEAFRDLCEEWKITLNPNDIRQRFNKEGREGKSVTRTRQAIIKEYWIQSPRYQEQKLRDIDELCEIVEKDWNRILSSKITPIMEGASELLRYLKGKNIPVVICSAGREKSHLKEEVRKYFPSFDQNKIYGERREEKDNKPNRMAFDKILKGLGFDTNVDDNQGWIIGDNYIDLFFAKNCKQMPVLVNSSPLEKLETLMESYNVYYASNLQSIVDTLKQMEEKTIPLTPTL